MTTHNQNPHGTEQIITNITGGLPPRRQQHIDNIVRDTIIQRFVHNLTARREDRKDRKDGEDGEDNNAIFKDNFLD